MPASSSGVATKQGANTIPSTMFTSPACWPSSRDYVMHVLLCAGGAGKQRQLFTITRAAAWGGQNCSEAAGTGRFIDCNNTGGQID